MHQKLGKQQCHFQFLLFFFFFFSTLYHPYLSPAIRDSTAVRLSHAALQSQIHLIIGLYVLPKSHKNTLMQVLRQLKDTSPFSWQHTTYHSRPLQHPQLFPSRHGLQCLLCPGPPWIAGGLKHWPMLRIQSILKTSHFLQLKWCANRDNLSSQCLVLARHLGMDLDMGGPGHFLVFDCFHHFMFISSISCS